MHFGRVRRAQGWAISGIEGIFVCREGEERTIVLIELLQATGRDGAAAGDGLKA
jgi:hypothetical protein